MQLFVSVDYPLKLTRASSPLNVLYRLPSSDSSLPENRLSCPLPIPPMQYSSLLPLPSCLTLLTACGFYLSIGLSVSLFLFFFFTSTRQRMKESRWNENVNGESATSWLGKAISSILSLIFILSVVGFLYRYLMYLCILLSS